MAGLLTNLFMVEEIILPDVTLLTLQGSHPKTNILFFPVTF